MLGRTVPRLWTPPLRELTPETSFGFDVIEFAHDTLRHPLRPWQQWAVIHGGELLPDGRPRFRVVHIQVARQQGKTEIPVVLSAYWQVVEEVPLVLGTSTKLDYARESWLKAVAVLERASRHPGDPLFGVIPARRRRWTRNTNGEQESWLGDPPDLARYKIAAANEEGGRSLTVHRLVLDELRQHHDYSAWDASVPAGNAVRQFQAWCLSNAGTDRSVVLNDERASALAFIETGQGGDSRTGWFEWSSPDDPTRTGGHPDPEDLEALTWAQPELGRSVDPDGVLSEARKAKAAGGDKLTGFLTEQMCRRVQSFNAALSMAGWTLGLAPADLSGARSRIAVCVDVAPDELHATLVAAAVVDDRRVRVEAVRAWDGAGAVRAMTGDLPDLVARIRPQAFGWFPAGPAAAAAADLADRKDKRRPWPPAGVTVEAIRAEVTAVCMGFANLVTGGDVLHSGDPLLDTQAAGAEKLAAGDGWRFARRGAGHVDGIYAAAGAAHLARTLPAPLGAPRVIIATRRA